MPDTNISKRQYKLLHSLQVKKYRKQHQAFLVEGEKSVVETLQSSYRVVELYCTTDFAQNYAPIIEASATKVLVATANELKKGSHFQTNNSCLAIVQLPEPTPIAPLAQNEYALVLDGIQDPGNLGTIVRIADWYGIGSILCSPDTVDVYNPKVIASCMGSFLRVNTHYTDLEAYFQALTTPKVYGAFLDGANLHEWSFPKEAGYIVLGNESKGIRASMAAHIHQKITIPRFGQAESLNVAMATAVICDHVKKDTT
ncbi:RNA methyltransferase [uncultured Microscilla sp.]|uniref:TrmH family RNA methyltransferase n=1 Tax=uncultured Microscilla sp. TaxID=432653 RepID=UPI00260FD1C7|nr:RNA methyltransferase [uncultured Microscilla sp.]